MKSTLKLLSLLVVSIAALGTTTAATAKDRLHQIIDRGELVVGTGSSNPPWHFKDAQGNLVGFDIDISRIIAKNLFDDPNKVKFVIQSDSSRVPNIATDKVDITCQFMTVTGGRAQQVAFTVAYYREGVGFMMQKAGKYKTYDDLKAAGSKVDIAVLKNVFAESMVHAALPDAKVDQYDDPNLMYQALNSSRADAAATDVSSLKWFIKQKPDQYIDAGYYWNPQSYSCAVRQGQPIWLHYVNTVLEQAMMGVDFDAYQTAFEKWFGEKVPAPKIGFPAEFR